MRYQGHTSHRGADPPVVRLPFKPFNEDGAVRIYDGGFLPHWRQAGCTYFVTFRLADSLPHRVLEEWKYERKQWLAARGVDLRAMGWRRAIKMLSEQDRLLFERFFLGKLLTGLDEGHGECVLRLPEISQIVADSLWFFHATRLTMGDFVVMPNHVHALMTPLEGFELETILHSIKSFTAQQINSRLGRTGSVWMEESYDHVVRDSEELVRIQHYIRANPAKAHLPDTDFRLYEAEYDIEGD